MFCLKWPTLGGELSVAASEDVQKMHYVVFMKSKRQTHRLPCS